MQLLLQIKMERQRSQKAINSNLWIVYIPELSIFYIHFQDQQEIVSTPKENACKNIVRHRKAT